MNQKIEVTPEIVQAVRDHECTLRGHDWVVLKEMGKEFPVAVVCSNCGVDSRLIERPVWVLPSR